MNVQSFNLDYVQKLAAGDPEVERHFTTHFGALLRIKLRTKLRSSQLIEDIRQETFLRVLQSLRKENGVRSPERLGAFVNAVCNNVMMESFRAANRLRQMPEDTPEAIDEAPDQARNLVTEERKRLVREILKQMPAKERELLKRVFFDELEKNDICREMNVNGEYLRVLLHRAKARFRAALKKRDPEIH